MTNMTLDEIAELQCKFIEIVNQQRQQAVAEMQTKLDLAIKELETEQRWRGCPSVTPRERHKRVEITLQQIKREVQDAE